VYFSEAEQLSKMLKVNKLFVIKTNCVGLIRQFVECWIKKSNIVPLGLKVLFFWAKVEFSFTGDWFDVLTVILFDCNKLSLDSRFLSSDLASSLEDSFDRVLSSPFSDFIFVFENFVNSFLFAVNAWKFFITWDLLFED